MSYPVPVTGLVICDAFKGKAFIEIIMSNRAVDKLEYLVIIRDNFCSFCIKSYVVTPHLNRLDETVQMRGHKVWFR